MTGEEYRQMLKHHSQVGTKQMFDELPECPKCNDWGFVTIIYPLKYSAIRVCDCKAAHKRFGRETWDKELYVDDKQYWSDMQLYFGGKNKQETKEIMDEYVLAERKQRKGKCERIFEWVRKETV